MAKGYFITGTDTEVGKTFVTAALLHAYRRRGLRAVGMKPIAAGCVRGEQGWINEDVERLRSASGIPLSADAVNVYAFRTAIAPHLAAQEEGVRIDTDRIVACFERLVPLADVILVEGAGGWLAPINETETLADVARRLALPVVLVVGMRLGCINHALLSAQSIAACGLPFAGWVANRIDPQMASFEGNLASLVARLPAPLLASIAYQSAPDPSSVAIRLP